MEIPKTYDPSAVEEKWYSQWLNHGFFSSKPDAREPFTIVIPPPNVTGVLHMGHALNNTIQDVLIRMARMQGKNACWVPGTDHASIATEAKVVAMLKEQGIDKNAISREEFLKHAWDWKEKYGGIILQQLKKLGASCDWDRTTFTMDDNYYKSVIKVFVDLYNKGLIYRGTQMINWDPQAKTALSDEEVNFKEVRSKLYYVRYKIADSDEYITIATTRPETILGDTAICVHPNDERYKHLVGKQAIVPLVNRAVPIIADEYVEMEFGTGALKVTPAHDKNDYELGKTHNLPIIDIFTEEGKLNAAAQMFVGEDRFKARKLVVAAIEEAGDIVKVEEIQNNVGYSERTDAVVEPRLSQQWFCDMEEMARPAIEAVSIDDVELYPAKFKNVYRHWMENIREWCISRQLWWGQRIPAYYLPNGEFVVAETVEDALQLAKEKSGNQDLTAHDLRQENDVLDTWFSSWLWPMAVFNGILEPNNEEINYYYPTNVLVSGHDIIFFWIARMIMAGYEYREEEPFHEVYFTGMVRDKQGRKMSKQLGNSPDLLALIENFGADAVRFGVLISSPAGNDLLFDEKLCEQGRNFANKMWNAMRLIKSWEANGFSTGEKNYIYERPVKWFRNRLLQVLHEVDDYFEEFRLSEALNTIYKLIWDNFCSDYLEMIKPHGEQKIDRETYESTVALFESLLKMIHPFMPFVSEEIWHTLKQREGDDFCTVAQYPAQGKADLQLLASVDKIIELVSQIRYHRSEQGMSPKTPIELYIRSNDVLLYETWRPIIVKLANVESFEFTKERVPGSKSFTIKTDEFYIPQSQEIDVEAEREKLQKELEYTVGFLKAVKAKLSNERFVQNARPDILEKEQQKLSDAETKIKLLEENLASLN